MIFFVCIKDYKTSYVVTILLPKLKKLIVEQPNL